MRIISAVIVTILMLWVGLRYCWLTIIGETDPVFAGWLVLAVSIWIAFWTYLKTKQKSLIDNIGNTADFIAVTLVIITISIFGQNVRAGFNWFEISNLVFAGVVLVFWWMSKNPLLSNLAIQLLMVIGFIPIYARIAMADVNPEPWSVWIPAWIASTLAMIPAYSPSKIEGSEPESWKDVLLPKVYATRSTILITILLVLMLRLELN